MKEDTDQTRSLILPSSSGKTPDFESGNRGSNPWGRAKTKDHLFLFYYGDLVYKKWKNSNQPSRLFNKEIPDQDLIK